MNGDKFMPDLHSKWPGLTYSTCRLFTKHHEKNSNIQRNRKFKTFI